MVSFHIFWIRNLPGMYPSEVTTYVHVHVCTIASKFFNVHIEVVSILVFSAKMVISHIDFMLHNIET